MIAIKIRYSDDATWGNDGYDGYDVTESYAQLETQVAAAINAHNPEWKIEFEHGINDDVRVSGDTIDELDRQHEIETEVSEIVSQIWQSWDWAVDAE